MGTKEDVVTRTAIQNQQPAGFVNWALTSSAAICAETATYPIDFLKTRLQLQGEQSTVRARQPTAPTPPRLGAVALAASVIKNEGISGLYAGLSPAAIRHVFYSGTRIPVYEQLRNVAAGSSFNSYGSKNQAVGSSSVVVNVLCGLTAGAVGQAIAVPADLIKVRMQGDGRLVAAGLLAAPRYKGVWDAFTQIVRTEGGLGLWQGAAPAVQRAALVNLGELATYDTAKQALLRQGVPKEGPIAPICASLCSGFVAALVSTPADVIKTRLMNQDMKDPLYKGSLDCLTKSVRAEGVLALVRHGTATERAYGTFHLVLENMVMLPFQIGVNAANEQVYFTVKDSIKVSESFDLPSACVAAVQRFLAYMGKVGTMAIGILDKLRADEDMGWPGYILNCVLQHPAGVDMSFHLYSCGIQTLFWSKAGFGSRFPCASSLFNSQYRPYG